MEIRKAQRKKAKLRLGIAAPSGAGKTYSALLLAFGIGGKVGVIDTEHGSADLYEDLGEYDIINIDALSMFEKAAYDIVIMDSLSHGWAGDGGLLDKQGKLADRGTNSFAAWRTITPEHNGLVEAILTSPCHIIATMRAKQEYVLETNEKGKQTPKKVGLAPVQREGMEYEFTVMLDIDMNHIASSSKDRTRLFDGQLFKITQAHGEALRDWLENGVEQVQKVSAAERDDLLELMSGAGLSALKFCEKFAISSVADLPRDKISEAQEAIEAFRTAREERRAARQTQAAEQQSAATH